MVGASVDHIAAAGLIASRNLESGVEWVPHPRRCHRFANYKTGEIAVVLFRD